MKATNNNTEKFQPYNIELKVESKEDHELLKLLTRTAISVPKVVAENKDLTEWFSNASTKTVDQRVCKMLKVIRDAIPDKS